MPTPSPTPIGRARRDPALALAPAVSVPDTVDVLGIPLAHIDYDGTLDWIDAAVARNERRYVCVAATHTVMAAREDPELRKAVLAGDLTVPDGQPLVWAMNAFGAELQDRVYGPELMARACGRAARNGTRMFLYGGRNQGALVQLAYNLRTLYPGLQIVGGYAPPYRALSAAEEEEIVRQIDRSRADVVWVGIGVPKQEKWMAAMRPRLQTPVLIGVGAAFDFHAGLVPQAPAWMQESGLEWLFRLAAEPRRLGRRYLRYNPRFVTGFTRQWVGRRRALRRTP
jgi:N-acetylglucosaminyldiphosphoundecaprenol N-acetyl-beta-D-mannosaminyltransferase